MILGRMKDEEKKMKKMTKCAMGCFRRCMLILWVEGDFFGVSKHAPKEKKNGVLCNRKRYLAALRGFYVNEVVQFKTNMSFLRRHTKR